MGTKYNQKYKKGKFLSGSIKSQKADYSRNSKNITENYNLWKSDTRKYDFPGLDTKRDMPVGIFKYKFRSKKKLGKKANRQNKHYRRYWY